MLFNSIEFVIFLPVVFIIYWFLLKENHKIQNLFIVVASYFFYSCWNWRFLSLIFLSSTIDYLVGLGMNKFEDNNKRKILLLISICVNIGFLAFFKYFNFFAKNFADAFTLLGKHIEISRLNIILPVGISFYTFQSLSYSIDVYRRKIQPTKDAIAYYAFVSFFPQLVAGPIERAANLLPQFTKPRNFDYTNAVDGCRQILLGLFKKIVIADNAAIFADEIFGNYSSYSGSTLLLGSIFFAFQIYGDFSGYSDIAIGSARLFGFRLMQNFAYPYFSRDIAEFWRRWHISLTTWFRDYVYIPLGGSRGSTGMKIRNTFIIFLVSGFWHGANWTYIIWGALNAIYFLPLLLLHKNRRYTDIVAKGKLFATTKEYFQMGFTFILTVFAWIFFRSESVNDAFIFIKRIFSSTFFSLSELKIKQITPVNYFLILSVFLTIEWLQRDEEHAFQFNNILISKYIRISFYYLVVVTIIWFAGTPQEFIYFQF